MIATTDWLVAGADWIFRSASATSRLKSSTRQSARTGLAPKYRTTSAVAAKVMVGTITLWPGFRPMASSARGSAAGREMTPADGLWFRETADSHADCFVLGPGRDPPTFRVPTTS